MHIHIYIYIIYIHIYTHTQIFHSQLYRRLEDSQLVDTTYCTATYCTPLQPTSTHRNTPQHTTTQEAGMEGGPQPDSELIDYNSYYKPQQPDTTFGGGKTGDPLFYHPSKALVNFLFFFCGACMRIRDQRSGDSR